MSNSLDLTEAITCITGFIPVSTCYQNFFVATPTNFKRSTEHRNCSLLPEAPAVEFTGLFCKPFHRTERKAKNCHCLLF